ncbi:GNAT family protein [Meiothermus sp. CFH 77666]|uniref:GNAT family N-acetyltransferase n=1 Tax=Meiothermus sp. CFH 77666 TaxID=2817942 RepID=UPI001AA0A231|nr:GNAT family protein [Meiothermus sp. CFH 77666]MBO1437242.1 GNAT family N-acetyltransferase [Meiothermus sp. CFH 77666]
MLYHLIGEESELRLLQYQHAEALYNLIMQNREHLGRWLPWIDEYNTVNSLYYYIRDSLEAFSKGTELPLTVWHQSELAGMVGLYEIRLHHRKAQIGYWLGESFQGKGLIYRSIRALLAHAFTELGLGRVEIQVASHNPRSRAVPERLGFKPEGVLRQAFIVRQEVQDLVVYGMTLQDWFAFQASLVEFS